jgi:hypothetical protein
MMRDVILCVPHPLRSQKPWVGMRQGCHERQPGSLQGEPIYAVGVSSVQDKGNRLWNLVHQMYTACEG